MSRCALLPTPGDPFLIHYWLKSYENFWKDEVDALYVLHNSAIQKDVEKYIKELVESKGAYYMYIPEQVEHGEGMRLLLNQSKEDYIMFIEDDAFVFKSGQIDRCFSIVESKQADIVASKRGSASDEIIQTANRLYNLVDDGVVGDTGPNFWPCYFFAHRSVFDETDKDFGAKAWRKGEEIESLNHIVQSEIVAGDTMVHMSLQLRKLGFKIHYEPHYHGSPDDMKHYAQRYNLWDGKAFWTHVGSLSTGVGGVLSTEDGRSLARKNTNAPPYKDLTKNKPNTLQERNEWERRVQWWLTFYQNREEGKIEEFAQEYKDAIDKLIAVFELDLNAIRKRQMMYKEIGLW